MIEFVAGAGVGAAGVLLLGGRRHTHTRSIEYRSDPEAIKEALREHDADKEIERLRRKHEKERREYEAEMSRVHRIPVELLRDRAEAMIFLVGKVREGNGVWIVEETLICDRGEMYQLQQIGRLVTGFASEQRMETKSIHVWMLCNKCSKWIRGVDYWCKHRKCATGLEKDDL